MEVRKLLLASLLFGVGIDFIINASECTNYSAAHGQNIQHDDAWDFQTDANQLYLQMLHQLVAVKQRSIDITNVVHCVLKAAEKISNNAGMNNNDKKGFLQRIREIRDRVAGIKGSRMIVAFLGETPDETVNLLENLSKLLDDLFYRVTSSLILNIDGIGNTECQILLNAYSRIFDGLVQFATKVNLSMTPSTLMCASKHFDHLQFVLTTFMKPDRTIIRYLCCGMEAFFSDCDFIAKNVDCCRSEIWKDVIHRYILEIMNVAPNIVISRWRDIFGNVLEMLKRIIYSYCIPEQYAQYLIGEIDHSMSILNSAQLNPEERVYSENLFQLAKSFRDLLRTIQITFGYIPGASSAPIHPNGTPTCATVADLLRCSEEIFEHIMDSARVLGKMYTVPTSEPSYCLDYIASWFVALVDLSVSNNMLFAKTLPQYLTWPNRDEFWICKDMDNDKMTFVHHGNWSLHKHPIFMFVCDDQ
jgi:hypothetical protein